MRQISMHMSIESDPNPNAYTAYKPKRKPNYKPIPPPLL